MARYRKSKGEASYFHPFWTRATTEIHVKLGGLDKLILALINHGSEINILFRKTYEKKNGPLILTIDRY